MEIVKNNIIDNIENILTINTHSHHFKENFFVDFDLNRLLMDSYVNWSGVQFSDTHESREKYLQKVRYKSYFIWLQKSLKHLYNISENLSADNWDEYSVRINEAHKQKDWHKSILTNNCNYKKIILDAYWAPGSNNGDSQLFAPTFRIDPLFFGFDKNTLDHDKNNVYQLYKKEFDDIDSYENFVRELIISQISKGNVALKNAIAYDRGIDYIKVSKEKANQVFMKNGQTKKNIKLFQDYIFSVICELASELNVPIQCHAGSGCLNRTNSINMIEIIKMHTKTKFVLFHGGFPWADDLVGLLHAFSNVYVDLCWLPILSPSAAQNLLHQVIEIGTTEKICWGCDTWTSEESFGAKLAMNYVLEKVLYSKIVDNYLSTDDAIHIAENILYFNPKELYKIT